MKLLFSFICLLVTSHLFPCDRFVPFKNTVSYTDKGNPDEIEASIKAYCQKKVVGYISYTIFAKNKSAAIYALKVEKAFRRKGIGSQLITETKSDVRPYGIKEIDVYANAEAICFYQKNGALIIEQNENDMLIGGNAFMKLKI